MPRMPPEHTLGPHTVRIEGDVLHITLRGEFALQEMQKLVELTDDVIARHGFYGAIFDGSQVGAIPPAVRRMSGQWPGLKKCYGNVIYGASFSVRTIMSLVARGLKLFSANSLEIAFFKSEPEARAWLTARRPLAAAD